MTFRPVVCIYHAATHTFEVAPRFKRVADEQFKDTEEYPLEVRENRSSKSHQFYFASIKSAHDHLTDANKDILKTPEHLRKWALITAGWYEETLVEGGEGRLGKEAAMRMAAFARKLDDYAEIKVVASDGTWFMRRREAKSQSRATMNKDEFKQSSHDVLEILAGTIEVTRRELEQAGRHPA